MELAWARFAFYMLLLGFTLNAFAAYSIGPVPIEWLSRLIFLGTATLMLLSGVMPRVPSFASLHLLFYWAILSVLASQFDNSLQVELPKLTTPYPIFVFLRFLNLLSSISVAYLAVVVIETYSLRKLVAFIIWLGTIVAVYAVYVYLAQLYGLPELLRSRGGTGGGAQATVFSYAFHRALGTFREPSHLAEWLLAPLFVSLAFRNRIMNPHTIAMTIAFLLTGSLAGVGGFVAGLGTAVFFANPLRVKSWKAMAGVMAVLVAGLLIFSVVAAGTKIGVTSLPEVLGSRAGEILFGSGIAGSNRGDIIRVALQGDITAFGYGFGKAHLVLSENYRHTVSEATNLVLSFHSLYLHYLYANGVVGLGLLFVFIMTPIWMFWQLRLARFRAQLSYLVGGVAAYATTNSLLLDELTPQFVIMAGLTIGIARMYERSIRAADKPG